MTINTTSWEGTIFISLYHFHQFFQFPVLRLRWLPSIFNRSACKYQASTWILISFYLLVLCQILLTQFPSGKLWTWTHIDYHPITKNETTDQVSQPFPCNPHSSLKIMADFGNFNVLYFGQLKQILFLMGHLDFSLRKVTSNDLNYLNVSTIQILELRWSAFWLNEAIWK